MARSKFHAGLCIGAVVGTISSPVPVIAQDFGDLLNLLGQAAQEDMRRRDLELQRAHERQQQQAHEQAYQRQLSEQQRREAARQQAEIDAQREAEIALTKRTQTALTSLGFYSMNVDGDRGPGTRQAEAAYLAAFDVPDFYLDEYNVQQLERVAASGFRSQSELERAHQGGFQTRPELIAAEAGGFQNASEYLDATALGFKTARVYREFQRSGFEVPAEFAAARRGGFRDPSEYREASAAEFTSRDEFLEFRKSGLPDRAAYEKANATAAKRDEARSACMEHDGRREAALETAKSCLIAVNFGVEDDEFLGALEGFGGLLTKWHEAVATEATTKQVAVRVASLPDAGLEVPEADQRVSERDAALASHSEGDLNLALKAYSCAASLVAEAYEQAEAECDFESATFDVELQARVMEKVRGQRLEAEAEAERQREDAEEEQRRLALAAARDRADELLEDISDFTGSERVLIQPIEIAKAVVALKQARTQDDVTSLEQANLRLAGLLHKEADFRAFLEERENASKIALINARTTALAETERLEAFIRQHVAENLLSDHVDELLNLQTALERARASDDLDQITRAQKEGREAIADFGLQQDLAGFALPTAREVTESKIETASNGLAVTPLNEKLLEGDARDILVLGNYTPDAPHLVLNLLGEPVFDQRSAFVCWYGSPEGETPSGRLALNAIRELGVDQTREQGHCDGRAIDTADVVVLRRGDFLTSDVLRAKHIVSAFEDSNLRIMSMVAWSDVGDDAERSARTAEQIESDVLTGTREGFGLLTFRSEADTICLVGAEEDGEPRARALQASMPELDGFLGADARIRVQSLDRTFYGIQRAECSTVYAGREDLKALLEGLQRAEIAYSVVPVWIEPAEVEAAVFALAEEREAHQVEAARQTQQHEALAALAAEEAKDAEAVRRSEQAALRQEYGEEAKAAFNEIDALGRAFFIPDHAESQEQGAQTFARLFPQAADWKRLREADLWEVDRMDSEMLDFGTAEWQGRRAEAVFARFDVNSKNRHLGKYSQDCFVLSYIIDAEFSMIRDATESECDKASDKVEHWKAGRSFVSRWVVE